MIQTIVVEDDLLKFGQIKKVLIEAGAEDGSITHCGNMHEAIGTLTARRFDLLLLDVNVPKRFDEKATRGGGLMPLDEFDRDPGLHRPRYIVGVTAYEDVLSEFGDKFEERLWSLVHYSEQTDLWRHQISAKFDYIQRAKSSENFSDGVTFGTDLAVVCALDEVELGAVRATACEWQSLRLPHDDTRYFTGAISGTARRNTVVAAAAPRMGLPEAGVLASKMISQFRPRVLAMTGICAGRTGKVGIGDIIIADFVWDWGAGKIEGRDGQPHFLPSAHQIQIDPDFRAVLKDICADVGMLAQIKSRFPGPKPDSDLRAHLGPIASGAAVVADSATFKALIERQRDLLGLEMESYAVAAAARGSGKPRPIFLIAKSVSDFADAEKDDDFQAYAAFTSAAFVVEAAKRFL